MDASILAYIGPGPHHHLTTSLSMVFSVTYYMELHYPRTSCQRLNEVLKHLELLKATLKAIAHTYGYVVDIARKKIVY